MKMTILQWNIQGLETACIQDRIKRIVAIIKSMKPSVVMLQEVVAKTYSYLEQELKESYTCYSSVGLRKGSTPAYFSAMLLSRKDFNQSTEPKLRIFYNSTQARDLLIVSGKCQDNDVILMTSHMESLKSNRTERKRQLADIYDVMVHSPPECTVVFGGDTNLRDAEVAEVVRTGKFDLTRVGDVWEILGSPPRSEFTWDLLRNDNQIKNGKGRFRYDRLYTRIGQDRKHFRPEEMRVVGTKRLPCGMFPSDHWGILVTFTANPVMKVVLKTKYKPPICSV